MGSLFGSLASNIRNNTSWGGSSIGSNYIPLNTNLDNYLNEKMFINDSPASPVIKNELLNKLKNGTVLSSQAPDSMPFERFSINSNKANSYLVSIEDSDNGNIDNQFLDILNRYRGVSADVIHTEAFFQAKSDGKTEGNADANANANANANDGEQTNGKKDKKPVENPVNHVYAQIRSKRSIFNPHYAIKANGFHTNKPLLDFLDENDKKNDKTMFVDTSDCSIKRLVEMSSLADGELGSAIYRIADFMYCKDLGKVSNNHLITLRRYNAPIGDNIFRLSHDKPEENMFSAQPDIGRLVTWFGTDDNKLSDILKMSFHATWKEMNAEIQEVKSEGAGDGILGMIANTLNPAYNRAQGAGITNNHNLIAKAMGGLFGTGRVNFGAGGQYNGHEVLTNYDKHRIYEPKNTIQSNHYYEGKLEFSNEFTLNFSYKLRAYGDMNQKAVMLDLIANILRVTYTEGKFWGGSVKWVGPPGNNSLMKKMHAFIDGAWDKLSGFAESFLTGAIGWQEIFGSISDATGKFIDSASDEAKKILNGGVAESMKEFNEAVIQFMKDRKFGDAIKGQLKNALGRPAVYAINSLVSGEDLGLWHLTIGNPLNPIAVMGNLILTNAELSFGDVPLGLDDFPTEIKVAVTLKHCKPRDLTGIAKLFTKGEFGLSLATTQTGWQTFLDKFESGPKAAENANGKAIQNNATTTVSNIPSLDNRQSNFGSNNPDVITRVSIQNP